MRLGDRPIADRMVHVRSLVAVPRHRYVAALAVTGLVGGAVGAGFLALLEGVTHVLGPQNRGSAAHLLVMVVVGCVIAGITHLAGPPSDVEVLVDNIHVEGGSNTLRHLRSLIPESLLCIGAGGSLGPEAPLVTTTGSLGSRFAHRLGLDRRERRIVSIAGMAAGFTVLFGAPLGSTMFALEILHRRGLEYYEALLPSAIGAVCGQVVYLVVSGLGLDPVFPFPTVPEVGPASLAWGLAAGIAGSVVAIAFVRLCLLLRRVLRRVPVWLLPALGGAGMGGLAFVSPHALTNGKAAIVAMNDTTPLTSVLLVAAAAKLLSAAIAVVTGWKGGYIIPLFFVGYTLARAVAPSLPGADGWVLAAAAMVAVNVGVTKTPIGSTLVVTEMAGMIVLPSTLIAALTAMLLTANTGLIESQRNRLDRLDRLDASARTVTAT